MAETDEEMVDRLRKKASQVEVESILAYDSTGRLCRRESRSWSRITLRFVDGSTFDIPKHVERKVRHIHFHMAKMDQEKKA